MTRLQCIVRAESLSTPFEPLRGLKASCGRYLAQFPRRVRRSCVSREGYFRDVTELIGLVRVVQVRAH